MNATAHAVIPMDRSRESREPNWFQINAPDPADVDQDHLVDAMAHHLLYRDRGEHSYSLAQHAMTVAKALPSRLRMAALLYRATQVYMGDISIVRPLFCEIRSMEADVRDAIYRACGVSVPLAEEDLALIEHVTVAVTAAERRDLLHEFDETTGVPGDIESTVIVPMSPLRARSALRSYVQCLRMSDLINE